MSTPEPGRDGCAVLARRSRTATSANRHWISGGEFVVGHWARGEELLGESLVLTTYESTSRPASRRP